MSDVMNRHHSLHEYMHPTRTRLLSCIVLPQTDGPFEIDANMIQILPIFRGVESENPYQHVREFEQICRTMQFENMSEDSLKLRLFTFSLKERAKSWFYNLRPQSITTWDQLTNLFFRKFFPHHRTIAIRHSINCFVQLDGETLFLYFERFNDLLLECPHHGFEKWRLVAILYEGLDFNSRVLVESLCNGEFIDKTVDDAWSFLAEVAEKTHQWESIRETRTVSHDMGDLHESDVYSNSDTNIEFLIRRVEDLERCTDENFVAPKLCNQTEFSFCILSDSLGHLSENCSELHAIKQSKMSCANTFHQMHESNLHSPTCDLGRVNNPNISCTDDSPQGLQPAVSQVVTLPNENERSGKHMDYECEMFVFSHELNSENGVSYPVAENVNTCSPILEADVWEKNTNGLNGVSFSCICDDDDDMVLEEVVNFECRISEFCNSDTLEHIVETSTTNNSFDLHTSQCLYMHEIDADLGLVQLFCEDEHDLGKVESSVDTNNPMHENNCNVSDSLPMSNDVVSSGFLMHEMETLDDRATDLGLVGLFFECEHAATLVDDLGDVNVTSDNGTLDLIHMSNLDVPTFMPKSQIETLPPNLDSVYNKILKPSFLRIPSLGLELCASQVLLDHFAAKYNVSNEPQLECMSLLVPNIVHFELDLVHDAPMKLLDFVPKSISNEKSRFGGNSFWFAVSLAFMYYYNRVRLLKFPHSVVVWVDPQLFRLYLYDDFFLYIIQ